MGIPSRSDPGDRLVLNGYWARLDSLYAIDMMIYKSNKEFDHHSHCLKIVYDVEWENPELKSACEKFLDSWKRKYDEKQRIKREDNLED